MTIGYLKDYKPHRGQIEFHNACNNLKNKTVIIVSSIRSGKSYSLVNQIVKDSWNAKMPSDTGNLVCGPDWRRVTEVLEDPVVNLASSCGLLKDYNATKHKVILKNGNKIYFKSLDNFDAVRGLNVWDAYVDEGAYVTKEAIDVVKGRLLTHNGRLVIASTPKGFNSYLYEDYFAPTSRLNAIKIKYSLRDNPLITEEAIEELYRNYDHKMALQELEGEFVNLNDSAVYRSFSREFNLRDIEHNPTIKTYIGVDYNVGINASVVIQKINGIFYVVDEIYGLTTTQDLGRELMSRYTNFTVIDDATGNNRQIGDGLTQREILKQCGIRDIQSHNKNPERIDRYAVVNALFKNGKDEISLYISPKCKKLIGELESLAYKINTNTPDDRNNKAGHITDAMGYALYALTGGTIYPSRILQQRRV